MLTSFLLGVPTLNNYLAAPRPGAGPGLRGATHHGKTQTRFSFRLTHPTSFSFSATQPTRNLLSPRRVDIYICPGSWRRRQRDGAVCLAISWLCSDLISQQPRSAPHAHSFICADRATLPRHGMSYIFGKLSMRSTRWRVMRGCATRSRVLFPLPTVEPQLASGPAFRHLVHPAEERSWPLRGYHFRDTARA